MGSPIFQTEPVPQATLEVLGFPFRAHALGFFAEGEMSANRKIDAGVGSPGSPGWQKGAYFTSAPPGAVRQDDAPTLPDL